jgi:hypothetical protein
LIWSIQKTLIIASHLNDILNSKTNRNKKVNED